MGTDSVARLNASATSAESIGVTAPSTAGTYYYGACVDSVTDESDDTNNCSAAVTVSVGEAPAPDLVVDTPTVSESAPAAGERFTLSATVRNQGNGESGSTTLRYYQSSDSTITTSDTSVGTDSVARLNASATSAESIGVTAPSTAGTYYYGACVDSVTDESDDTNNCSAAVTVSVGEAPASVPDLVVNAFTVGNSNPVPGQYFTLSATVRNQGNGESGSTTIRYYRSTDATVTTSDAIVPTAGTPGYLSVEGLSPSGSVNKSASTPAPSALGTYYYGACVETVAGESDATNNCSIAATITIDRTNKPPRLTGNVDDKAVKVGDSFTVDLSGLFTDPDGDDITSYGFTFRTSGILSGIVNTSTGILSLRAIGAGETIVAVDARDSNGASGASEDLFKVTVSAATAPDLTVDTPTVDDSTPETGDSFTLSATVRNRGNASSASTTLRYYRSSDSTITTSDTQVGTDSVSGLSSSGSTSESINLTAPSTAGTYYYGACVDSVSDESVFTNNCSGSVTVTVSAATAPDLTVDTPTVDDSTPETGDSFTLSATVRNRGNASSASTTLRYYRSSDSTITTSDTQVGTDSVSGLSSSGSSSESISLTAPSTAGTYYYGACVDSVSDESVFTNNCSGSVTVTVAAAQDSNPTPTGKGVTGEVTSCTGEQITPGFPTYRITIKGNVTAKRDVENVRVTGTFNGSFVGIDIVGDMDEGDTESFSITGIVSEGVGTCGAEAEWLEVS